MDVKRSSTVKYSDRVMTNLLWKEDNGRTFIWLKRDVDLGVVAEAGDKVNIGTTLVPTKYAESAIRLKESLDYYTDGLSRNTTGELFTRATFDRIREVAPAAVRDTMYTYEDLINKGLMNGVQYNRSVLGSISGKKEIIEYHSRNIMKNQLQTQQRIMSNMDLVQKYTGMLTESNNTLNGVYFNDMTVDGLYSFLKNKPHYTFTKVIEHDKNGYKLVSMQATSKKNIQRAKDEGWALTTGYIANKSKAIINQYKVPSRAVGYLNKFLLAPYKMGYLATLGFLGRNVFDSTWKNVETAGDMNIIGRTVKTWGAYLEYKRVLSEMMGSGDDAQKLTRRLIAEYKTANPEFNEVLFTKIHAFIQDGPSAGQSYELQKYYDDVAVELASHKGVQDDVLSVHDVRAMLQDPPEVTRAKFVDNPIGYSILMNLKKDQEFTERAISMAKYSKNNKLNTFTIANYLKRPESVPVKYQAEFDRLQKYNSTRKVEKTLEKLVYNRLSGVVTDVNGHLEQVFRLTQYFDSIEKGYDNATALHRTIKTHFDPTHKSTGEYYMEMLFPFSTFTVKNMHYWLEHVASGGSVGRFIDNVMTPVWDFDNESRSQWDLYNRKSLQYFILSGAIPYGGVTNTEKYTDWETGDVKKNYDGSDRTKEVTVYKTVKLSPSILDTFKMLTDPTAIADRLATPLRVAGDIHFWNEDWDNDGNPDNAWDKESIIKLIPFVNSGYQRLGTSKKYYEDTHDPLIRLFPSIFGRTLADSQTDTYQGNPNFDENSNWIGPSNTKAIGYDWYNQSQGYKDNHRYELGLSYQKPDYSSFDTPPKTSYMYNDMVYRNGEAKITRSTRNMWYNRSDFYKDLYTTKAKSKLKLQLMPITPENIKYRVRH